VKSVIKLVRESSIRAVNTAIGTARKGLLKKYLTLDTC